MDPTLIGERLKAAREAKGLGPLDVLLALRSRGFTTAPNTLARWERTGSIKAAELAALAEIYETSINELVPLSFLDAPDPPDPSPDEAQRVVDEARAAAEGLAERAQPPSRRRDNQSPRRAAP